MNIWTLTDEYDTKSGLLNEYEFGYGRLQNFIDRVCPEMKAKVPNLKNPNRILAIYKELDPSCGWYTGFGLEVTEFSEDTPEQFERTVIPPQTYLKYTSDPGPLPIANLRIWDHVLRGSGERLDPPEGYKRDLWDGYDFEVYDERAFDHSNAVVDLYLHIVQRKKPE